MKLASPFVPPHLRAAQPSGYELFSYDDNSGIATWRKFIYDTKNPESSTTHYVRSQDTAPILDDNKANQYNAKGTFTQRGRMGVKAATIPLIVQQKWLEEDGIDLSLAGRCEWTDKKIKQKLNSSDYAYLRVAEFTV